MENKELEALKEKYADYIATLSDEDRAKVDACKTAEELIALAQDTDGELPDEIVEVVAGGKPDVPSPPKKCPRCGSGFFTQTGNSYWRCGRCDYEHRG